MAYKISRELVINESSKNIWAVLANLETIQDYDGAVLKSYYLTEKQSGVGAARKCELPDKQFICERVIHWDEGKSYTIEVYEDQSELWPCEDQIASFRLSEQGQEKTLVTMEYLYTISPNAVNSEDEIKEMADELISGVLNGLKSFIETGEVLQINH